MGLVTNVFNRTAFFLFSAVRMPISNIVLMRYQAMRVPVWLPVSSTILPEPSRTPTPIRSQSGSVPMMASAPIRSARSEAIFKAGAFSGFGEATVGNRPSGMSCSGTVVKLKPRRFSMVGTNTPPVPCNAVKTILSPFAFSKSSGRSMMVSTRFKNASSMSALSTLTSPCSAAGTGV